VTARPLRLGLVTPGFSASESDWCIPALLDLVRGLAREHDVRVLSLRYPFSRRPYRVHGAAVQPLGAGPARGPGRFLMWARALRHLRAEHARRPFDALHALWAHEPAALALWAGRRLGVPVLVSVLGGELELLADIDYGGSRGRLNQRLVAYSLRHARWLTAGSRFLEPRVRARAASPARVALWPLGVDGQRFQRGPVPSDAPTLDGRPALLHVASLVPVKDQALLLEAFSGLRAQAPEARLHVVGDGPLRGTLQARVARLELTGQVRFHGSLPHDALPPIYRQAHVLVQSSRFESQGLVTLEAAASGCPALGTAVGVLPELFPAWTAPPGEAAALTALLERALANRPAPPSPEQLSSYGLPACVAGALALYVALSATERG
jgi:glycosyltransferase involved in cell wall biosynthesis